MASEYAKVSVWDRGFVFGDAVYEVCRIYSGKSWLEEEHFDRLERSLSEMEIKGVDLAHLQKQCLETIAQSRLGDATLYIQITRGVAPRAHAFPDPPVKPTVFIAVRPYDDSKVAANRQHGVTIRSYPDLRWGRCDVKSTNLLANCIALEHVKRQGAFEAALHDPNGLITEATHSSLLWVTGGRLQGTPEHDNILPGCTRLLASRLAGSLGMKIEDRKISLDELKKADEVILMGTTIEVMPVTKVDDTVIAGGTPGPVTRNLQKAYKTAVREWLDQTVLAL
ncbi:MAG: aminotransferase class IV [Isosphaeraceae bacterium]